MLILTKKSATNNPFRSALVLAAVLGIWILFPAAQLHAKRTDDRGSGRQSEKIKLRNISPGFTPRPKKYPLGEELVYMLKWTTIPAGQGRICIAEKKTDINGTSCFHITTTAVSNKFVSMFYPVKDKVESFIDASRLCSVRYVKRLRENKYKRDEKIDFDYSKKVAHYFKHVHGKKKVNKKAAIPGPIQDPLSALFYLRNFNLKVGTTFPIKLHTGGKNWTGHVDVLKKTIKRIRLHGAYEAFLIEIRGSFEGIFVHRDKSLKVWVEKHSKIPIFAHAALPFGSININLVEFRNTCMKPVQLHEFGRHTRDKRSH